MQSNNNNKKKKNGFVDISAGIVHLEARKT